MLGSGATHIPLSETTGKIPVNPNESRCCPSLCPRVLVIFGMMIPQHPSKPCPMPLLWKWKDPPRKKKRTIYPLTSIDCNWNAWRIIPVSTCKWLITMVSKPPFSRVVPLPNFLSEMILQVHPTRYRHRPKTMEEQARGWGGSPNWDMLGGQVKFCLVEMLHHVLKRKLIQNILQEKLVKLVCVFFLLLVVCPCSNQGSVWHVLNETYETHIIYNICWVLPKHHDSG